MSDLPAEIKNISATNIIMQSDAFDRVMILAETMSGGVTTVPKHLQGSRADCAAVIMQAMQWNMNPFAVAQKTHLVNGTLGYEAQLVNAVLQSSGSVSGRPHYEYKGEGEALECRVGFVISGEKEVTWSEWLCLKSVTIRNSPLWKANTKQQFGYLQVKNWARQYCPGAILGVYTPDELDPAYQEKEINPAQASPEKKPELPTISDNEFIQKFPALETGIKSGRKNADQVIQTLQLKYTVSESQMNAIRSVPAPINGEAEVVPNA